MSTPTKPYDEMPEGRLINEAVAELVMKRTLSMEYGIRYKTGRDSWGQSEEYTRQKCENYIAQGVAERLIARPDLKGFDPSGEIGDAWQVIQKLRDTHWIDIQDMRTHYCVMIRRSVDDPSPAIGTAATAPLAICRAALKAVRG